MSYLFDNTYLFYKSPYGVELKDLPKIEQFLLKKLSVAPNLSDETHIQSFKDELQKELLNYSFDDTTEEQIKDNTRILSKFIKKCIPKDPKLKDTIPIFTSDMFEDILVRENNDIVALTRSVLQDLLMFLKALSKKDKEELQNTSNEMKFEYILNSIQDDFVNIRYKISECLQLINHNYSCHLCPKQFKSNVFFQKHLREDH